jgi:hypothetical protein
MKRSPTWILLLVTMFSIAACGVGESGQSEDPNPAEPRQTQAEPTAKDTPEKTTREESTRKKAPAGDEVAQSNDEYKKEPAQRQDPSGFSVTTLEGEEVILEEQDEVTALFFMAGW